MSDLKKSLTSIHLWGISVGLVISGDYFGWNFGWATAGFWEFFASVGFVAFFYIVFSLSFTELATSIPHAGGPSAYAYYAFGPWGGFLAGFFTLVEFVLAPPAIASALGGYFHFLLPIVSPEWASFAFFLVLIGVNLLGVKQTARFELIVTLIAVFGLLFYFFMVFPEFRFENLENKRETDSPGGILPGFRFESFFSAIPYAIWFFLAVEGVAMAAEEVKNPKRDIPIGYTAGIGTLILLAFGVLFATAGSHSIESVSKLDYPLSFVLGGIFGVESWQAKFFTFIGLFGLVASLMGIILGYSRQIYSLAREGFLPRELAMITKRTAIPSYAVLFGGSIGMVALSIGDTDQLITLAAMGACGMYVMSMLSFFKLRFLENSQTIGQELRQLLSQKDRTFRVPFYPLFPGLALVLGVICFLAMAAFHKNLFFILGIGLFLFSFLFRFTSRKKLGRIPRSMLSPQKEEGLLSRGDTDI